MPIQPNEIMNAVFKRTEIYARKVIKDNWREGVYIDSNGFRQKWVERKYEYSNPLLIKSETAINALRSEVTLTSLSLWVDMSLAPYMYYHHTGEGKQDKRPIVYNDPKIFERIDLTIDEVLHDFMGGQKPTPNMNI